MRTRISLLWMRATPPAPSEIELIENSSRFLVHMARDSSEGIERLLGHGAGVVLADFPLPGAEPAELLNSIQDVNPRVPVIIRDAQCTVAQAVHLMKSGAWHVISEPLDETSLIDCLQMAADKWRWRTMAAMPGGAPVAEPWKTYLVGESRSIRDIEQLIRLAGPKRATVLISGETGTGKEVVARALHHASPRAQLPMVAVNCGALPDNLLDAELFGHVKGAFTGAVQHRAGRFEQAHKSTLFLDEISELPLDLQSKLLRVLQEREFQRVGSSETLRVDVRIIAASNADLRERVMEGKFREDLYYRLNVVPIHVSPLRERVSDIPLLVHHFLEKIARSDGSVVKRISRAALDRLTAYSWPGNVRQVENAVERAVVLSGDRMDLGTADFSLPVDRSPRLVAAPPSFSVLPAEGLDFDLAVANFQRRLLEQALDRSNGNKTTAADLLRMKRTTLLAKLRNLEIQSNVIALKRA